MLALHKLLEKPVYDKVKLPEKPMYDKVKRLRRFFTFHDLHTSARIPCHLNDLSEYS